MTQSISIFQRYFKGPLVLQILIGIVAGGALAAISPDTATSFSILGEFFVKALKAVAPILVFVLVAASIANQKENTDTKMKPIIILYLLGTFLASLTAVLASFVFPTHLTLDLTAISANPPQGIGEVLHTLLFKIVVNPIEAIANGNFIGILAWSLSLGITLRHASESTKIAFVDVSHSITRIVHFIIRLAPLGIFGLVANTIAKTGFSAIAGYSHLLFVLIGSMLFMAFVINPIIVSFKIKRNPYPLVWRSVRESGVTAFFTRSSAANIPVNMDLCRKMKLNEDTYSVSIPLGAAINMGGAAITITVLTLAAVHTLGIEVDMATALLLSIVSAVSACGASGVAGGSLLLIPLACSLFGISNDVAMQVVAIGFIIGVIQDSTETALNSSTDVLFTAAACIADTDRG